LILFILLLCLRHMVEIQTVNLLMHVWSYCSVSFYSKHWHR
jgi:hypothetical protein